MDAPIKNFLNNSKSFLTRIPAHGIQGEIAVYGSAPELGCL
jgi:hypothetical protein